MFFLVTGSKFECREAPHFSGGTVVSNWRLLQIIFCLQVLTFLEQSGLVVCCARVEGKHHKQLEASEFSPERLRRSSIP